MVHSAASTRPSTPFYYFNNEEEEEEEDAGVDAEAEGPPPSYSSNSSSAASSPRSMHETVLLNMTPMLPLNENGSVAATPRSSTSTTRSSNGGSASGSLSASIMSSILGGSSAGSSSSAASSSEGTFGGLSSLRSSSSASASTAASEADSSSDFGSSTGSGSGSGSGSGGAEGESTATRTLRYVGGIMGDSRLSSRAGSPAPTTTAMSTSSSSALAAVTGATPSDTSAVHHHIHHHYHHSSSSSSAASTSGSSTSYAPSVSSGSGTAKGKSKERNTLLSTVTGAVGGGTANEYAIPTDDPYFNSGYHYRSGPLARKLGSAILSRDPSLTDLPTYASNGSASGYSTPSGSHRRRSGWKSPRPRKNTDLFDDGSHLGLLDHHFNNHISNHSQYRYRRRISAVIPLPVVKAWQRFLRHPLVPTQPLTLLFSLAAFALFAFSVTTFMYHILNTDKAPRPWRAYCQEQRPFPHELADSLAPVDVFVGVFSVDAAYERRHLIRSTYLRHSRPIDPNTGRPGQNVQVKFILGRPRKHHARRIALEMETYDDIVVLDVKENMNKGKTHAFFRWANENATVPIYYKPPVGKRIGKLGPSGEGQPTTLNLGFKKADYVVKADDDSFLVLSELERHLRVAPRKATYWGYLIRNLFMGGECYALSSDLVNYVATHLPLEPYTTGAEDKRVAKWMRMHPNASSINWVTERCYVYDHPKAGTTYSHGFLFPDEVERVRAEGKTGISVAEKQRRGGELADAWSTVTKWKAKYVKPKNEMTMEEEVEALVEGGGRWTALDGWTNKISSSDVVKWESVVFEAQDERIKGSEEGARRAEQARAEHNARADMSFGKYNRMPNSLIRDPGDTDIRPQNAKRGLIDSLSFWKRSSLTGTGTSTEDDVENSNARPDISNNATSPIIAGREDTVNAAGMQFPIGAAPSFKQGYSFLPEAPVNPDVVKQKAVPAPSPRFESSTLSLRERRFLGLPYGGTVVVHYLKRNEWFLETALALLGREKTWDTGLEAPAYRAPIPPHAAGKPAPPPPSLPEDAAHGKQGIDNVQISPVPTWNMKHGEIEVMSPYWGGARMYGSPLIRENGFISLGRTVPWDALQKTEDAKYGKLKSSPRQGYANLPPSSDSFPSPPSSSSPSSSSGEGKSQTDAADSPASDLETRSIAGLSDSSSPSNSLDPAHGHDHSHSSPSSLLLIDAGNSETHAHTTALTSAKEAEQEREKDTLLHSASSSSVSSPVGLHIQNPALAALELS